MSSCSDGGAGIRSNRDRIYATLEGVREGLGDVATDELMSERIGVTQVEDLYLLTESILATTTSTSLVERQCLLDHVKQRRSMIRGREKRRDDRPSIVSPASSPSPLLSPNETTSPDRYTKIAALIQILSHVPEDRLSDVFRRIRCDLGDDTRVAVDISRIPLGLDLSLPGVALVPRDMQGDKFHVPQEYYVLRKGKHVTVDKNFLISKSRTEWDEGTVLIGPPVESSVMSWSFRFDKGTKATVGVCLHDTPSTGWVNKTDRGWGYFQASGHIGHAGVAETEYGVNFADEGDVVDVEIDADSGVLRFIVNGEPQGDAFDSLPVGGRFVAAVSLMEEGSRVLLFDNYRVSPGLPLLLMAMNRAKGIECVREELCRFLNDQGIEAVASAARGCSSFVRNLLRLEEDCVWTIFSFIVFERINVGVEIARREREAMERERARDEATSGVSDRGFFLVNPDMKIRQKSLWD